jgi:two-component system chemotaxis response regulator CheY
MSEPARKRVLVVDDATLVRIYYRNALERAGFEVEEALNGLEALERILVRAPDVIVADINMPQMDGLTFVRELRKREFPIASIPALITSSEAAEKDVAAARAAGANFYLVKPVEREKFVECVALLIGVPA